MSQQLTCPRCGAAVAASHRFCPTCATPLHGDAARVAGPTGGLPTIQFGATPGPASGPGPYAPASTALAAPTRPGPLAPPAYAPPTLYAPAPQPLYSPPPAPPQPIMFAPMVIQQVQMVQPVAPPPAPMLVVAQGGGPGFFVRALYFLFVGWWLSFFWISLAWLLNATILGLPLGLTMLNRVPQVMTLSPGSQTVTVQQWGGTTYISTAAWQYPLWARALYFIFIGWWVSLGWTYLAYALALTIIGLPVAFLMFHVLGFVTTLRRN